MVSHEEIVSSKQTMKQKNKQNIINLKELRQNMSDYISRVNKGESFTVLKRSKPAFKLSPIDTTDNDKESAWETIIDFTEIDEEGVSGREILKKIKQIDG